MFMAIARKKENPGIASTSEIVFREVVKNSKDIKRKREKLENACTEYGSAEKFRLYFSVNARNTQKGYFRFKERLDSWIEKKINGQDDINRKLKRVDSHWKSELQKPNSKDETSFLYDLDTKESQACDKLIKELEKQTTIKLKVETPNGHHIVTKPFNHNKIPHFDFEVERLNDRMFFVDRIN